jgi:hypothetical protein
VRQRAKEQLSKSMAFIVAPVRQNLYLSCKPTPCKTTLALERVPALPLSLVLALASASLPKVLQFKV